MARRCLNNRADEVGFTLIEVLMALTVFALISSLAYGALDIAGNGFERLAEVRSAQEKSGWAGKQLRSDLRYVTAAPHRTAVKTDTQAVADRIVPIRIQNDNRGSVEFDQLWLLVRESGQQAISQVHYYIDETNGHLMRESRLLLTRERVEPVRWDFGEISSWAVEIWDRDGNHRQDWDFSSQNFVWPKAVAVTMKTGAGSSSERQRFWLLPVLVGSQL
ncbi:MAG: hypothetical protein AUJ57_01800 [Zetaproteobacteria bacterium CG1_02_53_45]|nr:MAG: hypothetical protein AUJ57_01800 [Zetaproteobacteria bacterium CG1_02_53_45]